jgi:sigma-B regulation protein RsbU (phosphoserine phosphatase)
MSKQYLLIRALRCATIALFLSAGLEGLRQIVLPGLSAWQSHIVASSLCAFVVLLLTFGLLWRGEGCHNFLQEQANGSEDSGETADEAVQTLAAIVEFSQDAIIGKTVEGVITSWNRAAERIYGYTMAEAVGRNVSFLLPSARQDEMPSILERVRTGQPIEPFETQRITKMGSVLDVFVSISPIKDARGRIAGASTIARDITLRKRAEEQLRLQSAALEAAAVAIMITDFHGSIMWVNHAFTTMTGYSKEEVLGTNPRLLKAGDQPEAYYAKLWTTISSGKVWQGEIVNRRKDGTLYTEEMTITPVSPDSLNPDNRYFIAIKQDVTERKRSEEMLQNSENKYRVLFENSADATG